MNRRTTGILALVCAAVTLIALVPLAAQTPVATQASPQTVKAAIPPQAAPMPVPAPQQTTTPAPQARPAQAVQPAARPELAPAPKSTSEYEAANVKVEVTITYQVGNAAPVKRMATLTVADGGRSSLRSGTQVAVPSTTFQPAATGAPATMPMTSYSYKSVGLNIDANRVFVLGNKARLDLNVEFSAIDEKPGAAGANYPLFPTFSQNLTLVLESGKPVVVGQSSDVVDNVERKQVVEVKATILR